MYIPFFSDDDYIELFGSLSNVGKKSVRLHKTFKKNLVESLNEAVELMVEEEKMKAKFNNLDKLIEESALFEGKETW